MNYVRQANVTAFHESFLGAAFILPLIPSAGEGDPLGYLHNHPTSSIAYAVHFGLRIVGHRDVQDAYSFVLQGYYHRFPPSPPEYLISSRS